MYELTPFLHYIPILIILQPSKKIINYFILLQTLFFIGREFMFFQTAGGFDFSINPEKYKDELDAALSQVNGNFDYYAQSREYPSEMSVFGYAAINYNLHSLRSGAPEFTDWDKKTTTKKIKIILNQGNCDTAKTLDKQMGSEYLISAGFNCGKEPISIVPLT
jgi:hypothetical protein